MRFRPGGRSRLLAALLACALLGAALVAATFEAPLRSTLAPEVALPAAGASLGSPSLGDDVVGERSALLALSAARAAEVDDLVVETGGDGCQVALVGDSLVAWAEEWHETALEDVGCAALVDGFSGRVLAEGWQCPPPETDEEGASREADTTCRPSGLELIEQWRASGTLGDLVVVALGVNDAAWRDEEDWRRSWEQALTLAEPRPVLLVTIAARPGSTRADRFAAYNEQMAEWCAGQDRCALVDWADSPTATDPASYVDRVHLGREATQERARFLADAVAAVVRTDGRPPAPFPRPARVFPPPQGTQAPPAVSGQEPPDSQAPSSSTSPSTSEPEPSAPAPEPVEPAPVPPPEEAAQPESDTDPASGAPSTVPDGGGPVEAVPSAGSSGA